MCCGAPRGAAAGEAPPAEIGTPDYYKNTRYYKANRDVEDIYAQWDSLVSDDDLVHLEEIVAGLLAAPPAGARELEAALARERQTRKRTFRKAQLLHAYRRLVSRGEAAPCDALQRLLVKKSAKSQSGVLVITVLTSPYPRVGEKTQRFSCEWNCYFCPSEPGQPKSYLHEEPAVKRANENAFDAVLQARMLRRPPPPATAPSCANPSQFTDRAATLAMNGHPVDKIELLVLGGTWASYPHAYQEEFCRDLFYAANTFWERAKRPRLSLSEEQTINETAAVKIIGLTLETRPDTIDADELRRLRAYGCTRVQLGLQHVDDGVLKKINRGCTTAQAATALRRLKDACYKVDAHIMPNLPGSSLEMDRAMFERLLLDPALQADQWKIYPTQVVPWTVLQKWYDAGKFKPYDTDQMFELLMNVKTRVHPWIRLNRVVRDIPSQYVCGGFDAPNLRQDLLSEMKTRGMRCRCIRCREVGGESERARNAGLVRRSHTAAHGAEHFLSIETTDRATILGFVRLRLPRRRGERRAPLTAAALLAGWRRASAAEAATSEAAAAGARVCAGDAAAARLEATARAAVATDALDAAAEAEEERSPFAELDGAALVRELHVYGQLIATADKGSVDAQHTGLGRRLMNEAEEIARANGYRRVAVIAGVGSRGYYRKLGYALEGDGQFMMRSLPYFAPGWAEAWRARAPAALVAAALAALAAALVAVVVTSAPPDDAVAAERHQGSILAASAAMLM